jgi:uncharacterized protein (TIGR02001 family)
MNRTFFWIAVPDRGSSRRLQIRLLALIAVAAGAVGEPSHCVGADVWGGSLSLTSDYLVRGISRSDDRAAVQADYHYLSTSGFVAGAFASTAKVDPNDGSDAELNAFLGFVWSAADEWHGKILVSQYAYPGTQHAARYNYAELDVDAAYQDWLEVSVAYSPNFPRYVPHRGLISTASNSAELNLQQPVYRKLLLTGGTGYSYLNGPSAAGYVYWSVGAACDLAPFALALSYVDTSAAAKSLFYDEAAGGRWVGTVIWRF